MRVPNMACKFMSKVVYGDIAAYQLDWLDIHHLFSDSLYIIFFSMSYWWGYNSGVVEQNKVRKSWWKVINNFVNIFTACQLNILFMQHWFQYILCHHWGGSAEIYFTWSGGICFKQLFPTAQMTGSFTLKHYYWLRIE